MDLREWDARYRSSAANLEPEPLVVSIAGALPPGRALDLACGAGRNALWLAARGWKVTAVDGSAAAIEILRSRSTAIDARVADLERGEFQIAPGSWDLIVICRYLQRDLFEPAKAGLVPGGVLIAVALLQEGGRTRHRVKPGELATYFQQWEVLYSREDAVAEIAARKNTVEVSRRLQTCP